MRAARSFAISMKKFMPMQKKNESRGANLSMLCPVASAARYCEQTHGQAQPLGYAPPTFAPLCHLLPRWAMEAVHFCERAMERSPEANARANSGLPEVLRL
jgi:hypothetical protein